MKYKITNIWTKFSKDCKDMIDIATCLTIYGDPKEFGLVNNPSIFQDEKSYLNELEGDFNIKVEIL